MFAVSSILEINELEIKIHMGIVSNWKSFRQRCTSASRCLRLWFFLGCGRLVHVTADISHKHNTQIAVPPSPKDDNKRFQMTCKTTSHVTTFARRQIRTTPRPNCAQVASLLSTWTVVEFSHTQMTHARRKNNHAWEKAHRCLS